MANLKAKNITKLETWNIKELRKLRMTIKNRLTSFEPGATQKKLPQSHHLYEMSVKECKVLLEEVQKSERLIKKD